MLFEVLVRSVGPPYCWRAKLFLVLYSKPSIIMKFWVRFSATITDIARSTVPE